MKLFHRDASDLGLGGLGPTKVDGRRLVRELDELWNGTVVTIVVTECEV